VHRFLVILLLLVSLSVASAADGATGRVVKVLPLLLDLKGRAALSPSLFDRDAYQAFLRQSTNEISAVRFDILWSVSHADKDKADLKLRLELRGTGPDSLPRATALEQTVTPHFFRHWTSLTLGGDELKNFGAVTAWHATLWSDGRMIAEQKSFLW
jgi:hypothetical protein